MAIKKGEVNRETALSQCLQLRAELDKAYQDSKLPEKTDIDRFEKTVYLPMMFAITATRIAVASAPRQKLIV